MKADEFLNKPVNSYMYVKEMAKELSRFTKALEDIGLSHNKDIGNVLELLLVSIDRIGKTKAVVPVMKPVKIDITGNRPTAWEFEITRDRNGLISKIIVKDIKGDGSEVTAIS